MYWYHNRVTQRVAEGEVVPGVYFPAFIHNGDHYLASIVAYKDGMVDCWGLVTFEEFRQKVRDGWVVTSVPDGRPSPSTMSPASRSAASPSTGRRRSSSKMSPTRSRS